MLHHLIVNCTKTNFVLLTESGSYFVEYLLGELVLSPSISEAWIFNDADIARKFQNRLFDTFKLYTSVNSFIDIEN
ncbi:hypothetical protein FEK29_09990 [Maribacter aurantiacus]|uniref:Uncharacterized protein n=2 Tax=Maribacter TaxID=252356 RepID=A0A5R8M4S4_9FLAO|nr:hypothetical protein F0361_16025 [Maribacter flavus]MDC6405704.1 hypothetical protein [Maribacter sp. PR66]TLF44566.1 hypothetical protein FEK29_09990 [Maribacter aurantiacus]